MRKREIIDNVFASAQSVLNGLRTGSTIDTYSLSIWSEALVRYVFNQPWQRTVSQYIENTYQTLLTYGTANSTVDTNQAVQLITDFMIEVRRETHTVPDLDAEIDWQPIFDTD
jgi:hypothetical protein